MSIRSLTLYLMVFSMASSSVWAALPRQLPAKKNISKQKKTIANPRFKRLRNFERSPVKISQSNEPPLIFDIPVLYNSSVKHWINYFQGRGRKWFRRWLERSHRYIPLIQVHLEKHKLPKDLAYVAMIESGFSSQATSSAAAVGPWQFMRATGEQYGLRANWWLDERRDWEKSTRAASQYFSYLYRLFDNWYLSAAAYNMGENRLKRLIKKYKTKDFWKLSNNRTFAKETKNYVPKLIAAILIAKAPGLYGFRDIYPQKPLVYDSMNVPGGVDLVGLADYLGVTRKFLKDLNPELIQGFIPHFIGHHRIRIPKGSRMDIVRFTQETRGIHLLQKKTASAKVN